MIKKISVSAFKSLVDFELNLDSKFNCIIGLNGAGKSSVLQLFSYVSALIEGKIDRWLSERGWEEKDVASHFFPTRETFDLVLDIELSDKQLRWEATYNWKRGLCTSETLTDLANGHQLLRLYQGRLKTKRDTIPDLIFKYSGSILSALDDSALPQEAVIFRNFMTNIDSHDLLSPKVMRSGRFASEGKIGSAGEYLISYIHKLDKNSQDILLKNLYGYFPQVVKIETKTELNGTLSLLLTERFYNDDGSHTDVVTNAKHINDGMLRILIILASQRTSSKFQQFDEVENGVNSEITEKLVEAFINSPQQVLITTHSPMVLNYIEDELAKSSITLVYKNKQGHTKATKLFALPSLTKKLNSLAPGDAMLDVYLKDAADEAELLANSSELSR
ncbi:DNA replication and repair protein RecF [Marinomonas aquimarina]|uniref:DNA replication and repair protein RecF n=1 Tax=Marinomonas aquimarina TaxID=295068 RepID=A0A1A8T8Z6_9GAMM|nr:AAA family ATPase [Marinomonas aquimarina]SBS28047.1 DNA replication and repair protein RecF [Marinomonas aquimarina]